MKIEDNPMPWKDPDIWLNAKIVAPLFAFVLSFLRTIYINDGNTWGRRFLESTICGFITLSATYAIDAMGIHGDWKYAVAGCIGFLGIDYVRSVAKRFIDKKVP